MRLNAIAGMERKGFLVLLSSLSFWGSPANAEWPRSGLPVAQIRGEQSWPKLCSDGLGGALIVWADSRDDFSGGGYRDLYAQRIDATGASLWRSNGIPVCTDSLSQGNQRIEPDGTGGAYIVWEDRRSRWETDIYLQHISATGEVPPGWATNGVPVCLAGGDQLLPRLAPDGSGGVFVAWEDERQGSSVRQLYIQHAAPDGAIWPGWPADGLSLCAMAGSRGGADMLPDGAGGFFIAWIDARIDPNGDLYGLRVTAEGQAASGWPACGVPICAAPRYQNWVAMVPDGEEGFIVVWQDHRTLPAASSSFSYTDLYAQCVTGSGAIAAGWAVDGLPVCTAFDLQQDQHVISDGAGGVIAIWSDFRGIGSDLYAQRLLSDGEVAPGWLVDGMVVSQQPGFQLGNTLAPDGAGGAWIVYETEVSGSANFLAPLRFP